MAGAAVNLDSVFRDSFQRVLGEGAYNPAFTGRFYEIFLSRSPAIAARFEKTDMSAQKTMLHDSLLTLATFHRDRVLTGELRRLAAIHGRRRHDVPAELYELWLDALVATVAEFDSDYEDEVGLAWRIALSPGICYMQYCYDR
jgi:hemoglobin-like flavoprotein